MRGQVTVDTNSVGRKPVGANSVVKNNMGRNKEFGGRKVGWKGSSNPGVRRSLNKKIFLFYLVRRRLRPANTGELVGGTGSHLLFNERRTPAPTLRNNE